MVGSSWKPVGSAIGKGFKKAGTAIGGAFAHPLKTLSRFDSAVGKVKVGSTLGEAIGFAGGALTGDDFVSGFMHDSGIKKKPDPAKETAANINSNMVIYFFISSPNIRRTILLISTTGQKLCF